MRRLCGGALVSLSLLAACGGGREPLPPPSSPLLATPDEAFRAAPPSTGEAPPLELPAVHRARLANGLTLILGHQPGASIASLRYVTRRGGEGLPRELAGRSWLVGRIIQLGASSDGGEERRTLATEGFDATVSVGFESASASVLASSSRLPEAIELLAQAIHEPSFSAGRVQTARLDALERLDLIRGSPDRRSLYWAMGMLYGLDHRAAVPIFGRAADLRSLSAAELRAHHHLAWSPRSSALIVVGDMEPAFFSAIAEGAFGRWEREESPPFEVSPWVAIDSPVVARGLGLRSWFKRNLVTIVERAPSRSSEDYVPFSLLSAMLGGLRSARGNEELRRRGVAAHIEADYDARLTGGELLLTVSTTRRGLTPVLETVIGELERLVDEGPSEDELEAARAVVRERLRASFDQTRSTSALLARLFVLGLELDEVTRLDRELAAVSAAQVRAVARRWLRPDRAPLVVSGNLQTIGTAFSRASIGPAVMRD